MAIDLCPYNPTLALHVLQRLDPFDQIESDLVRAWPAGPEELFAEWHGSQQYKAASFVATDNGVPFAVLGLGSTGIAGVAHAALLAKRHDAWGVSIAKLGVTLRRGFPSFCEDRGIYRVECRCWAQHPTAARFLSACGFTLETVLPGFGLGQHSFLQFAWTQPEIEQCA